MCSRSGWGEDNLSNRDYPKSKGGVCARKVFVEKLRFVNQESDSGAGKKITRGEAGGTESRNTILMKQEMGGGTSRSARNIRGGSIRGEGGMFVAAVSTLWGRDSARGRKDPTMKHGRKKSSGRKTHMVGQKRE